MWAATVTLLTNLFNVCVCTGDQTEHLSHAREVLYYWATHWKCSAKLSTYTGTCREFEKIQTGIELKRTTGKYRYEKLPYHSLKMGVHKKGENEARKEGGIDGQSWPILTLSSFHIVMYSFSWLWLVIIQSHNHPFLQSPIQEHINSLFVCAY